MLEITPLASNNFEKSCKGGSTVVLILGQESKKRFPLIRKEVSSLALDVYLAHVG